LKINIATKLQKLIFYSILLFLPTQLGRHFWPSWSYVSGLRIDYLSPTVYVTDILLALLFFVWLYSFFFIRKIKITLPPSYVPFSIFLLFILLGIFTSRNPQAGFYGFIKLLEYVFFGFYVAGTIKKSHLPVITTTFSLGVFFESFLAFLQYIQQGSIGGVLYFFGERTFTSQTPGIANVSMYGHLLLRPYGTFSHPNVLAGYLLIAMIIILFNQGSKNKKNVHNAVFIFGAIALLLTMSRIAIIVFLLVVIFFMFQKNMQHIKKYLFFFSIFFISVLFFSPLHARFFNTAFTNEAFVRRADLIQTAVTMFWSSPFFGVGLYNFLSNVPLFQKGSTSSLFTSLQPVHNIYLLIAAETGIFGFGFFTWFLIKTYKRIKNSLLQHVRFFLLITVLVLGLFDHYFLTLQQGQLLFAFVLGFCWAKIR